MAQYPVPQFIESEGKIISFLTFRQFFILVGGGAICLAFYYTLPFIVFVVLSLLVAILTFAVGFLKVDNTPVVTLFFNLIGFLGQKKNYTWQKKGMEKPMATREFGMLETQKSGLQDTKKIIELRKK